jgi:hypothetical protein
MLQFAYFWPTDASAPGFQRVEISNFNDLSPPRGQTMVQNRPNDASSHNLVGFRERSEQILWVDP